MGFGGRFGQGWGSVWGLPYKWAKVPGFTAGQAGEEQLLAVPEGLED